MSARCTLAETWSFANALPSPSNQLLFAWRCTLSSRQCYVDFSFETFTLWVFWYFPLFTKQIGNHQRTVTAPNRTHILAQVHSNAPLKKNIALLSVPPRPPPQSSPSPPPSARPPSSPFLTPTHFVCVSQPPQDLSALLD